MDVQVAGGGGDSPVPAREQVLSMPDLLERILEYAASGEPWKETRNLRLVCKFWRDNSVKALYLSKDLPQAEISTVEGWTDAQQSVDTYDIDKFRDLYPVGSRLPIQVDLTGKMNRAVYSFLADFAECIAEINLQTKRNRFRILKVPKRIVFNMVNLRRLYVWHNLCVDYPYDLFQGLLDKILEKADKLIVLSFHFSPMTNMPLPTNLTHMNITCCVSDLESLLSRNQLPRLVNIHATLCGDPKSKNIDLQRFNSLLEPFYPKLESFSVEISSLYRPANNELPTTTFLLPPTPNLKSLSIKSLTSIQEGLRLSDAYPNLINLSICLGESGVPDLNLFLVGLSSVYKNLKHLSFYKSYGVDDGPTLNRLLEKGLPQCPALGSFTCCGFSDQFLLKLMPIVFSQMRTIKKLRISLTSNDTDDNGAPDLAMELLTGLRQCEIPTDKHLWSSVLEGKPDVITNLTYLECFKMEMYQRKVKCEINPFLFKSAFFRMQNLKSVEVEGQVEVDEKMAKAWKADGREIKFPKKPAPRILYRGRGRVPVRLIRKNNK